MDETRHRPLLGQILGRTEKAVEQPGERVTHPEHSNRDKTSMAYPVSCPARGA